MDAVDCERCTIVDYSTKWQQGNMELCEQSVSMSTFLDKANTSTFTYAALDIPIENVSFST